jgi:hypothetical protein
LFLLGWALLRVWAFFLLPLFSACACACACVLSKTPGSIMEKNEATPVSEELKTKIKKQVEFYFSDSNYPRDKFLRTEASKDPEG